MFREILLLFVALGAAHAALSRAPLQPKPDKFKDVEGCYIEDLDRVVPFGSKTSCPFHCMEYRCSENTLTTVTCGSVSAEPPLKLVEDKTKPYPECCPKIVN